MRMLQISLVRGRLENVDGNVPAIIHEHNLISLALSWAEIETCKLVPLVNGFLDLT